MPPPPALRDYVFVCVNGDDQIVIENASSRTHAMLLAIKEGWYRATANDLECPKCGESRIERAGKFLY